MNSCLSSLQIWPVLVKNETAAPHSASVKETSFANACRC